MKKTWIVILTLVGIVFIGLVILIVGYLNLYNKDDSKVVGSYQQLIKDFKISDYELELGESKTKEPSFLGDGMELYKLNVSKEESKKLENMMKESWREGELSKEVSLIMYGGESEDKVYGYKFAEKVNMPKIDNGYWKLINENKGSLLDNANDFKLAVYDKENRCIYLFENHI